MSSPELVRYRPHQVLAEWVAGVVGFHERAEGAVERRQPAGSLLPLVLSFGDLLEVVALSDGSGTGFHSAPIAYSAFRPASSLVG